MPTASTDIPSSDKRRAYGKEDRGLTHDPLPEGCRWVSSRRPFESNEYDGDDSEPGSLFDSR